MALGAADSSSHPIGHVGLRRHRLRQTDFRLVSGKGRLVADQQGPAKSGFFSRFSAAREGAPKIMVIRIRAIDTVQAPPADAIRTQTISFQGGGVASKSLYSRSQAGSLGPRPYRRN